MRNLVECNIVIPKIVIYKSTSEKQSFIDELMKDFDIEKSHVISISPEKSKVSIDQIRIMQKDVLVTFDSLVLIVIHDFDSSGMEVQNSLLKIIEEESERLLFVLFVKNTSQITPTILSRCTIININNDNDTQESTKEEIDYRKQFALEKNTLITKDNAVLAIDDYITSHSISKSENLKYILNIRKLILDNNMNPTLALDAILLFLSKNSTIKVIYDKKK